MSKYGGAERLASFSFILFVLSWILLRLIDYPFWILRSTSYELLKVLDKEKYRIAYYYVFNTLLFSLFVLHVYWWRDVKMRSFDDANHRTYVDLKKDDFRKAQPDATTHSAGDARVFKQRSCYLKRNQVDKQLRSMLN